MIHALANHLWQSTLFAAAVALLTLLFRRNRAGLRYTLWLTASFKFLLPLALLMSVGSHWHWAPAPDRITSRIAAPETISIAVVQIARPFSAAPVPPDNRAAVIFALWAAGLVAIALLRLRAWQRVRAAVRSCTRLQLSTPVEVRSSPGLLEPGVVGFFRPILLLPTGIVDRLTGAQLEAVLAHELCHARRRDNLTSLLHMVVEALFWFHPLVWWIGARLVEERERACDEAVLSLGNQPRDYADAILHVCRLYAESPLVCVAGVTGANLKRRIEAIMTNRTAQRLNRAQRLLLAMAAAAALAGPILVGIGPAPVIHAQTVPVPAAAVVPAPQPAVAPNPVQARPAPPPETRYHDRKLAVILFDFSGMTADEQSRAQEVAARTVRTDPDSLFAILAVDGDNVKVRSDFTSDHAALEATIRNLGLSSASAANSRIAHIGAAVRFLASLPGKKSLIYFTTALWRPSEENRSEVQEVIAAAQRAEVAFYNIQMAPRQLASYEGRPEVADRLVEALNRQAQSSPVPLTAAVAGLPGGHASIMTFAQTDRFPPTPHRVDLLVPLGSLSGTVDVLGEIVAPGTGMPVNNVRDQVEATLLSWRTSFMLDPAAYECRLIVRERSTGRTYGETISFTVN
ncbi:MAG TPA: M56 family metallopeptidase [Bryobacteraceae bacterium]|nr:M56 family metallopeptidase [Bryobacteraceae bacterium]